MPLQIEKGKQSTYAVYGVVKGFRILIETGMLRAKKDEKNKYLSYRLPVGFKIVPVEGLFDIEKFNEAFPGAKGFHVMVKENKEYARFALEVGANGTNKAVVYGKLMADETGGAFIAGLEELFGAPTEAPVELAGWVFDVYPANEGIDDSPVSFTWYTEEKAQEDANQAALAKAAAELKKAEAKGVVQ